MDLAAFSTFLFVPCSILWLILVAFELDLFFLNNSLIICVYFDWRFFIYFDSAFLRVKTRLRSFFEVSLDMWCYELLENICLMLFELLFCKVFYFDVKVAFVEDFLFICFYWEFFSIMSFFSGLFSKST